MAQVPLRNLAGDDLGSVDVSDDVFARTVNEALVHQAVMQILANRRLGTHKTKTRANVSGGGAKPWRQKGTGRARQGSRVSPLWRGGGIVFGPVVRGYQQHMPKKMRRRAMQCGMTARLNEGAISAIDSFTFDTPRTRSVVEALGRLNLSGPVTVVADHFEENTCLAARNVANVELRDAASLNLVDVLQPQHLLFTRAALEAVNARLSATVDGGDS